MKKMRDVKTEEGGVPISLMTGSSVSIFNCTVIIFWVFSAYIHAYQLDLFQFKSVGYCVSIFWILYMSGLKAIIMVHVT